MDIHLAGNSHQRRVQLRRIIRVLAPDEWIEHHGGGQYTTNITPGKFATIFYVKRFGNVKHS